MFSRNHAPFILSLNAIRINVTLAKYIVRDLVITGIHTQKNITHHAF